MERYSQRSELCFMHCNLNPFFQNANRSVLFLRHANPHKRFMRVFVTSSLLLSCITANTHAARTVTIISLRQRSHSCFRIFFFKRANLLHWYTSLIHFCLNAGNIESPVFFLSALLPANQTQISPGGRRKQLASWVPSSSSVPGWSRRQRRGYGQRYPDPWPCRYG